MSGSDSGGNGANPLMPMQGASPGEPSGSPEAPGVHPALADTHSQASAQFDATTKAVARMDKIRTELTGLAKKGSAVTPEDVIQGAGKLVGGGEDPMQLASLMADMPTNGGDALAAWVAQHAATTAANEAKLKSAHDVARHSLGVASVHKLAAQSMMPQGQGRAMKPQGQNLAMMPTKGSA